MLHFIPTFGSRKVARMVNTFIHENTNEFWHIFKPLIPFIIGLIIFDACIQNFGQPFAIGKLFTNYFLACLTISWLRFIILGKDNYTATNPLKPQKYELIFMGTALAIFFIPVILTTAMPFITENTGNIITGALIGLIASLAISIFASYKFAFFFPSQATDQSITLIKSFKLTKGYVEKTISTTIRAAFKLISKMLIFIIVIKTTRILFNHSKSEDPLVHSAYDLITNLALSLYFIPLIIITGLCVLSHYYQEALEKKA